MKKYSRIFQQREVLLGVFQVLVINSLDQQFDGLTCYTGLMV